MSEELPENEGADAQPHEDESHDAAEAAGEGYGGTPETQHDETRHEGEEGGAEHDPHAEAVERTREERIAEIRRSIAARTTAGQAGMSSTEESAAAAAPVPESEVPKGAKGGIFSRGVAAGFKALGRVLLLGAALGFATMASIFDKMVNGKKGKSSGHGGGGSHGGGGGHSGGGGGHGGGGHKGGGGHGGGGGGHKGGGHKGGHGGGGHKGGGGHGGGHH